MRLRGLVLAAVASLLPLTAWSAPFDNEPKILLHLKGTTTKNACGWGALSDCQAAVVAGALRQPYFAYLLTARGNMADVAGLQCGIYYQAGYTGSAHDGAGVDIFSWTLCATLQFATGGDSRWLEPWGGNLITWDWTESCQSGPVAVAGYFYLSAYSTDRMYVIARPVDRALKMADCSTREVLLADWSDGGSLAFSEGAVVAGCNPCLQAGCSGSPGTQPPDRLPVIAVHVADAPAVPCGSSPVGSCAGVQTAGVSTSPGGARQFAYLVADAGSYAPMKQVSLGVAYDGGRPDGADNGQGIDILSWTSCADATTPGTSPPWPAPGSTITARLLPERYCPPPAPQTIGYFYLGAYSPDTLRVTPPATGGAGYLSCQSGTVPLPPGRRGYAVFSAGGSAPGCNPCSADCSGAVPVQPVTWSRIKTLLGR